jgi:hypothetical protein
MMADEKPVEVPAVAPVIAEVPVAAPAVVESPAVAPVAEAPVVAAPETPAVPEKVPSLLEAIEVPGEKPVEKPAEEKPAEPVKPAEEKPAEPEKPIEPEKPVEEVKAEEAPKEPVKPESIEYKYEIPETLTLDDARKGELHAAFDEFRANPDAGAQKLIDLHTKAMTDYAQKVSDDQFRVFGETKRAWETEAMSDEQIGGSAWNTSKGAIARMRDMFVSDAPRGTPKWTQDYNEFVQMLDMTGAGSHRAMLKLLHNVARRFDEPAPLPLANVKTVNETAPKGNPLHDNPRSQQRNGA